jgi:hypothetical protein
MIEAYSGMMGDGAIDKIGLGPSMAPGLAAPIRDA